uniref:Nucleoside diphosphate kinase n=1 Tax=Ditylenchus dipsaci TaxID=166011 RepID=A0A915D5D7_9BILA
MSQKESVSSEEKCFVIVKPDAIDRRLQYLILSRIANISGLKNLGIVFHVASVANVDVYLVNQRQLSAEDRLRLRTWLTTESSILTLWEGKDACKLVGNMKREIRRQYSQTNADGSLVDPMKNLKKSDKENLDDLNQVKYRICCC